MASRQQGAWDDEMVSRGRDSIDIEEQGSPYQDEGKEAQGNTYLFFNIVCFLNQFVKQTTCGIT